MLEDELKALLQKEERLYRYSESFLRSMMGMQLKENDVENHMAACVEFLHRGHKFDDARSPFIMAYKDGGRRK